MSMITRKTKPRRILSYQANRINHSLPFRLPRRKKKSWFPASSTQFFWQLGTQLCHSRDILQVKNTKTPQFHSTRQQSVTRRTHGSLFAITRFRFKIWNTGCYVSCQWLSKVAARAHNKYFRGPQCLPVIPHHCFLWESGGSNLAWPI